MFRYAVRTIPSLNAQLTFARVVRPGSRRRGSTGACAQ